MRSKIKKLLVSSYIAVTTLIVSGCFLLKDGETINWNKVDTITTAVQVASQTSVYAVCVKNKDLSPVFKAIGEGLIVLSGDAKEEQLTPVQIETYIKQLIDQNKWGTLADQINGITSALITTYTNFYNTNKDKFKDEVKVFSKFIYAMGNGFVIGSNINATSATKDQITINDLAKLDLNITQ